MVSRSAKLRSKYEQGYVDCKKSEFQNGITNDSVEENTGWKLHLNVTPEDSLLVSRWLKINNFTHKFLSGGKIEDGKIFTVYIGSYDLCSKLSIKISDELGQYLCKPVDKREVEFEPSIVGRFVYFKNGFSQYGTSGISEKDINVSQDQKTLLSFRELHQTFGNHFYH